ncbi:hypothetical protein [Papillibacter cinnamivorans]|uniref:Uncharacterized protein n=1 Tax=Papillibacter cinnamivorans DSM 12816 TaxID=1122930 RepID=A0A1W2CMY7_9FIRM|nr:hypothetical protein [Papillibacter cinnamivorans]SMC86583.1 hypothetical protein SAMN02745168_0095 [Papillibacter cinnamivorans DSM 12816]
MGASDRKRCVEKWKTAAIVLLALSSVYLTLQVQLYTGGNKETSAAAWILSLAGRIGTGSDSGESSGAAGTGFLSGISAVRIAVKNENGRYAVQYDTQETGELFDAVGNLLGEAVGSAGTPEAVSAEQWRSALGRVGVYFDFLGRIPLSALSQWLGADNAALEGSARRILLALGDENTATLYIADEAGGGYYACSTAVTAASLTADLSGYLPNGASFAFELGEEYVGLPPYTMVLPDAPLLHVLSAVNPMSDESDKETLLKALDFNPHTNSRYPEANGTEVIIESLRTLRIGTDGTVQYHNSGVGEGSKLRITEDNDTPTETEVLEYVLSLAQETVGSLAGEGKLYLIDLEPGGETGSYTLRLGYLVNGAGVYLYKDGYAAEFVIRSWTVSDATLYFRSYTATETASAVLPERQTAAAVAAVGESDLALSYIDGGGTEVKAGWIVKSQS